MTENSNNIKSQLDGINFAYLHSHNFYSIRDSYMSPEIMIARAKELGLYAIAETNHGKMYDSYHFYQLCTATEDKKKNKLTPIKPIIGVEVYIVPDKKTFINTVGRKKYYHLILLAKNYKGYQELCRSTRHSEKFSYKDRPMLTHEDLEEFFANGNIVVCSGCIAGEVQQAILNDNYAKAKEIALYYKSLFGDDYYLEYQNHGIDGQEKIIKGLYDIKQELGIETVITTDSHFAKPEDLQYHDIMICNGFKKKLKEYESVYTKNHCMKSKYDLYYDFQGIIPDEEILCAMANTGIVADKCTIEFPKENHYPKYPNLNGKTADELLREKSYAGLTKNVPDFREASDEKKKEYYKTLDMELDVIKKTGYADYFLNVSDALTAYTDKGNYIGPGRGSAAGSLVANSLNITKVNPLRYGLYFDRFLNLERVSPPDIDSDFDDNRKQAFDWTIERYGAEKVCKIVTFGTLGGRNAIRMVCRVLDVPLFIADKIAKTFPEKPGLKFKDVLDENNVNYDYEFDTLYKEDSEAKEIIDTAMQFEGVVDHTGIHAAACIIGDDDLINYIPLQWDEPTQCWVSQYYKDYNEELGLLKMDYLGLNNLTVFKETARLIKKNTGKSYTNDDLVELAIENSKILVREIYATGKTSNVFQFESEGIKEMLKKFKPEVMEDLIILNALYRPGPMQFIDEIIENKNNPQNIHYDIPELKPILDETYGCPVYQEQIMAIFRAVCGYSLGQADIIRRVMGKKKREDPFLIKAKQNFIEGYERLGSTKEKGEIYFNKLMDFASYAFNKSHATAYVLNSLESAYLKYFYPHEYMTACLSYIPDTDKYSELLEECKEMGFQILLPDINKSDVLFSTEGQNGIRFGLSCVKNVGKSAKDIIANRPYNSFEEFISKFPRIKTLDSGKVEALAYAGAFDGLNINRASVIANIPLMTKTKQNQKKITENQIDFFSFGVLGNDTIQVKLKNEIPYISKLEKESEMLFTYVTGHPLDHYKDYCQMYSQIKLADCSEKDDEQEFYIVARIADSTILYRKKDNAPMGKIVLEDLSGKMSAIAFTKEYDKYKTLLIKGNVKLFKIKLQISTEIINEEKKLIKQAIIKEVKDLDPMQRVFVQVDSINKIKDISDFLYQNSGSTQLIFFIKDEKKIVKSNIFVDINEDIENYFGKDNIAI